MSQGGFISLRAALTAPERVRALVLLDTTADVDTPEAIAGYQGMIDMWLAEGPVDQLVEGVAGIIISEPVENARWIAKWRLLPKEFIVEPARCLISRDDISSRLGEIACPAVAIHGEEDAGITIDRGEAMAAALPGCDGVVRIPSASHAANLTHPDLVNPPLLEFLRDLPA